MSIGERHVFSWIHLSDLHFGHGDKTYKWDQTKVLRELSVDIRKARDQWPELPSIQAILITGDIGFSGAVKGTDEYAAAAQFISGLCTSLGLKPTSVFMVPGNHDVQRDVAKALVERVRVDPKSLDQILDSPEERAELLTRQANYKAFADEYSQRNLVAWKETIVVENFGEVSIIGLNTALVSNDDADHGKLVLSGEQRRLIGEGSSRATLLLTHHPLEGDWLVDQQQLQFEVNSHIAVHLCGHVHDPQVNLISAGGNKNHHVRVVAAAAHRDPSETKQGKVSHGYNFSSLVIDAQGMLQLRTWPRRWFPHWDSFRVDHLGVPDRSFYDDKALESGRQSSGSGLVLEGHDSIRLAGVHWWGRPQIRWGELLFGKTSLDVFGIAVRELFQQPNSDFVGQLLARGGRVRVVLADPRIKMMMARYDEDFNAVLGDRSIKVLEALRLLNELRSKIEVPQNLEIRVISHYFKYSAYRVDGDVLFVPYRMIPGKRSAETPVLVFDKLSSVTTGYFSQDLDELIAKSEEVTPELFEKMQRRPS